MCPLLLVYALAPRALMFDQSGRVGVEAVRTARVRVGLRLVVMVRVQVRVVRSVRVTMVWPMRGCLCLAVMVLTELRLAMAVRMVVLVALWVVTTVAAEARVVVGMVSSHGLYLIELPKSQTLGAEHCSYC